MTQKRSLSCLWQWGIADVKTDLRLIKEGHLRPTTDDGDNYFRKSKIVTEIRNPVFHSKLITLFLMMHDILPAPADVEFMGRTITPEHTFNNTRKYLTVKAGYYNVNGYPDGSVRVEAKSISFANMDQDEFEKNSKNCIAM